MNRENQLVRRVKQVDAKLDAIGTINSKLDELTVISDRITKVESKAKTLEEQVGSLATLCATILSKVSVK